MRAWVAERVRGKLWWPRAPLLLLLLVPLRGYLGDPMYSSIFDGVNLGFHEMGHAAFFWLGDRILTTAGGTIFQLGFRSRRQPTCFGSSAIRSARPCACSG